MQEAHFFWGLLPKSQTAGKSKMCPPHRSSQSVHKSSVTRQRRLRRPWNHTSVCVCSYNMCLQYVPRARSVVRAFVVPAMGRSGSGPDIKIYVVVVRTSRERVAHTPRTTKIMYSFRQKQQFQLQLHNISINPKVRWKSKLLVRVSSSNVYV